MDYRFSTALPAFGQKSQSTPPVGDVNGFTSDKPTFGISKTILAPSRRLGSSPEGGAEMTFLLFCKRRSSVSTSVRVLLRVAGPAEIPRLVVLIIVYAVQGVLGWTRPQNLIEVTVKTMSVLPLLTDNDPPSTVVGIFRVAGVGAPGHHVVPAIVPRTRKGHFVTLDN
jgi:hypothetical protein